jgi:hypothetical protein
VRRLGARNRICIVTVSAICVKGIEAGDAGKCRTGNGTSCDGQNYPLCQSRPVAFSCLAISAPPQRGSLSRSFACSAESFAFGAPFSIFGARVLMTDLASDRNHHSSNSSVIGFQLRRLKVRGWSRFGSIQLTLCPGGEACYSLLFDSVFCGVL